MTATHTPGPWTIREEMHGWAVIAKAEIPLSALGGWATVCRVAKSGLPDARLIAAAPELLRGCSAALAYLGGSPSKYAENRKVAVEIIRDAIAKAEGGQL